MLELKSFDEIAGADLGWLKAKHHFGDVQVISAGTQS